MHKLFSGVVLFLWFFASAAFSTADGRIVFTKSELTREGFEMAFSKERSQEKGWWELNHRNICTINPDGSDFRQLTDDNVSYHALWSRDGQKIAFLSGPSPHISLMAMDSDGSNRLELISNQEDIYDFKWSPDSTSILVYVKTDSPRDPDENWIVTVGDDKSVKRMGSKKWARGWNHWDTKGAKILNPNKRLLDRLPEGIEWPEWSPDNNYIAFIREGVLVITDATTSTIEPWRPSKTEPPGSRVGDWSPDGSKLLFLAGGYVCSINADGTGVTNLSMAWSDDACWSPDMSKIAFISTDGRKRNSEIFIMNADGSGHTQITNTNYFHSEVDWR